MTVIRFDGRADHVVVNRPRSLDVMNDITALAAGMYRHLERTHQAFWRQDAKVVLDALGKTNEMRIAIRVLSEDYSAVLEGSPVVPEDQLAFWAA